MTYSIRPMRQEDVDRVTEIDREAFPTQVPPPNYRHELGNQLAHYIVACDDTKTAGVPEARPEKGLPRLVSGIKRLFKPESPPVNESPPTDEPYIVGFAGIWVMADEAHITNIAVCQQYQRRGIGELLLISIIDLAKELKASMMTLEVRVSNVTAQELYRKYGFERVGVRRGYYLDNREDGVLMSTESISSATFQARFRQLKEDLSRKWGNQLMPGGNLSAVRHEES